MYQEYNNRHDGGRLRDKIIFAIAVAVVMACCLLFHACGSISAAKARKQMNRAFVEQPTTAAALCGLWFPVTDSSWSSSEVIKGKDIPAPAVFTNCDSAIQAIISSMPAPVTHVDSLGWQKYQDALKQIQGLRGQLSNVKAPDCPPSRVDTAKIISGSKIVDDAKIQGLEGQVRDTTAALNISRTDCANAEATAKSRLHWIWGLLAIMVGYAGIRIWLLTKKTV